MKNTTKKKIIKSALLGSSIWVLAAFAPSAPGQPVNNDQFEATRIWTKELFAPNSENSHSYRIPGIIRTEDQRILVNIDKRIENIHDFSNTIEQVYKISSDEGETWSASQKIVSVNTPKTNKGLIIDGTFVEAHVPTDETNQKKIIYLFNIFAERAGIPNLLPGNPWVYVGQEAYLKLWVKSGANFDPQNSILKKVPNKLNWWRQYKLPVGLKYHQINASTQLIPTNTYVDNSYNSATFSITGQVYENVEPSDLNDVAKLKTKATNHSIWDSYKSSTKYYLAKNSFNAMLDSVDGGKTWTNFRLVDEQISKNPYRNEPFSGNGVGSGIQLKHQKATHLNGRIIFPMYNYNGGVQKPYIIYSDDYGTTWHANPLNGFKRNLTEGTLNETEDGELYYAMRQSIWGSANNSPAVTKSLDGGINWMSPNPKTAYQKWQDINLRADGNVFSGMSYFNLNNKKYFAFALPKENFRRAGSLYVADETFSQITEVFSFDETNREHFAYSYTFTTEVTSSAVDLFVVYEWSNKAKIYDKDLFNNHRPVAGGVQIDKINLKLKN